MKMRIKIMKFHLKPPHGNDENTRVRPPHGYDGNPLAFQPMPHVEDGGNLPTPLPMLPLGNGENLHAPPPSPRNGNAGILEGVGGNDPKSRCGIGGRGEILEQEVRTQ